MYYFCYNVDMDINVLIIDDSPGWRKFHLASLNTILSGDFSVKVAESARQAYDMVLQNIDSPFNLILCDLQMELDFEPEMAGEWLVKRIKETNEYSNSKIIMISAMYNIATIAEKLNVDYIRKSDLVRDLLPLKLMIESLK